jgi:hypothetical protein
MAKKAQAVLDANKSKLFEFIETLNLMIWKMIN